MSNMLLGIHSNIAGDSSGYIVGHAWLTITHKGHTKHYRLWTDAQAKQPSSVSSPRSVKHNPASSLWN